MKNWYQEATINGIEMPTQRKKDTSQKRWERYIEPLLPMREGLFVDLGCNAGFYMRKAVDLGFAAIGVEMDDEYIEHAKYWEENDPKGIKIIQGNVCEYDLPVCQVILLAKVHYWLTKSQLEKLIGKLKERALFVIVVGRHKQSDRHQSPCDIYSLRNIFSDFTEGKSITGRKHYSVIFKNPQLVDKNVDEVFTNQPLVRSRKFLKSFSKLINNSSNPLNSDYYNYLKWRKSGNPKKILLKHIDLIKDVKKNGIKKPLLLGRIVRGEYKKNILSDGDHRIIIAKELGLKKVICKINNNQQTSSQNNMKRMYQYIQIPGKALRYEGHNRDKSKFWNEGKWNNFIEPLLPNDCLGLPFLEIGSNSGLFLKMAENKGFNKVFGVERHPDRVTTAGWYKESCKAKFETLEQSMSASFDWTQLPRLGMTLIANTHYYMYINDFAEVVNSLRNRSAYCLIVSTSEGGKRTGRVGRRIEEVRGYFKDWTEVGTVENISTENDPSPRPGLYSIIFKSNLELLDVKETWATISRYLGGRSRFRHHALIAPTEDFYDRTASGEEFDVKKTPLYEYYSITKSPDRAYEHLLNKQALATDIKENGIKDLIYYNNKTMVVDGFSRLAIARSLGYKKVITKIL